MIMSQMFVLIPCIRGYSGILEYSGILWHILINAIITKICDIIIYKRGSMSVTYTWRG